MQVCKQHYYQIYIESPTAPLPTAVPELRGVEIAELTLRQLSQGTPPPTKPANEEPASKVPATGGPTAGAPAAHPTTADVPDAAAAPADAVNVKVEPQAGKLPAAPTPSTTPPLAPRGRRRGARASTAAATAATDAAVAMHPSTATGAAVETVGGMEGGGKVGTTGTVGATAAGGNGRHQNAKVETSGYMRFRDEFDPEYDGDAEQPIANLDFLETDTPELVSAKIRMLQIYNERLDERERRREMIKQMGCAFK